MAVGIHPTELILASGGGNSDCSIRLWSHSNNENSSVERDDEDSYGSAIFVNEEYDSEKEE